MSNGKLPKKPNILFFFTDDQRFDTIAALGNREIHTPNLDELVRNGSSFTHAHIPGGTVGAVCMPSRAMLHTGRTLFHLENDGAVIPAEHALMGETFRHAGYRTFGTGKWHNGPNSYARSFTDGGEIFFGGMWDHWNVPACDFDPTGKYDYAKRVILNPFLSNQVSTVRSNHVHQGKHSSELFCETAIDWLNNKSGDEPFFMYISFMAPHDPRSMPEEFLQMYDPEKIRLPENFMESHTFDYGVSQIRDELLAPQPRTPDVVRKHIAEYYGMISHLDNELGKVIQALKQSGEYENTILVFAGDNGLALGQHGLFGKQSNYEHSIRVPLIFAGPGIPKNEKHEDLVYLLDIFPTLCELTGIEIPDTVEGKSLVRAIRNQESNARETLFCCYGELIRSVKNHQYKLIEYRYQELKKTQLFDLQNDPLELADLYGEEGYSTVIEYLRNELRRYKNEWEDEMHPKGKVFWESHE